MRPAGRALALRETGLSRVTVQINAPIYKIRKKIRKKSIKGDRDLFQLILL